MKTSLFPRCLFILALTAALTPGPVTHAADSTPVKATQSQVNTGTDNTRFVTPATLRAAVPDLFSAQPAIYATQDVFAVRLALTNDLGIPIAVRVYDPFTNTASLSQVSAVALIDTNYLTRLTPDRLAFSTKPLTSIYTDAGWIHVSLQLRTLTNNGLGVAIGAKYVSTANSAIFISNTGPYWITASSGGEFYTNRTLLAAASAYHSTTTANVGGACWGQTNFFWITPTNFSFYAFKSDGVTVWSSNMFAFPW